jgi:hypothetical protein
MLGYRLFFFSQRGSRRVEGGEGMTAGALLDKCAIAAWNRRGGVAYE